MEKLHTMKIAKILILLFLSFICRESFAVETCPQFTELSLVAEQYRQLRHIKGHFDGVAWNKLVDDWSGKKHLLMIELARLLNIENCDTQTVFSLLGTPDTVREEHRFDKSYFYYWRRDRDYLLLKEKGGKIIKAEINYIYE